MNKTKNMQICQRRWPLKFIIRLPHGWVIHCHEATIAANSFFGCHFKILQCFVLLELIKSNCQFTKCCIEWLQSWTYQWWQRSQSKDPAHSTSGGGLGIWLWPHVFCRPVGTRRGMWLVLLVMLLPISVWVNMSAQVSCWKNVYLMDNLTHSSHWGCTALEWLLARIFT